MLGVVDLVVRLPGRLVEQLEGLEVLLAHKPHSSIVSSWGCPTRLPSKVVQVVVVEGLMRSQLLGVLVELVEEVSSSLPQP